MYSISANCVNMKFKKQINIHIVLKHYVLAEALITLFDVHLCKLIT